MDRTAALIRQATSIEDFQEFATLCRMYVDWCRERYKDIPWLVDEIFAYQALDEELKGLARKYGPPNGKTFLALLDGKVVGGGAWRHINDNTCEMKRVFVRDNAKGRGVGRKIVDALIASARIEGFQLMQLDTANRMSEAQAMYSSLGFETCPPYQTYPDNLMPFLVFMRKHL